MRDLCMNLGCHVISVNYRLAPKYPFPAGPDDVRKAVAYIRRNANRFRTDPKRLCLMGDSAGGMIVSHVGAKYTSASRVAGVFSFFGEHDFIRRVSEDPCVSGGMAAFLGFKELKTDAQKKRLREATCVTHVHPGMPDFLLIHGTRDFGVPIEQSHSMQQAMRRVGAKAELVAIVGGGHGIGGWNRPDQQHYKKRVTDWLRKHIIK